MNCNVVTSKRDKDTALKRLTMASRRVDEAPRANRFPTNAYPLRPGSFNISNGIMLLAVAFILRNIFFTVRSSIVHNDILVCSFSADMLLSLLSLSLSLPPSLSLSLSRIIELKPSIDSRLTERLSTKSNITFHRACQNVDSPLRNSRTN
jgi:hypothetical protein